MIKKLFPTILSCILCVQSYAAPLPDHYVGELQESWRFTSDHLPMGATIDDFHIVTWNVLNSAYIGWILNGTQGLGRSLIMEEHRRAAIDDGHSQREEHVIQQILSMIDHPTHPRSLLALQECGPLFLGELKDRLPKRFAISYSASIDARDQNVILYDKTRFTLVRQESSIVTDAFPCNPGRPLMDYLFAHKKTGKKYRIINAHVPGDPNLPGRYEMATYVGAHKKEDRATILLGDMNFNPVQMEDAFARADLHSFHHLVNYYTIVGTDLRAKALDHIFVDFGSVGGEYALNTPEEVLVGLQETVALLEEAQ